MISFNPQSCNQKDKITNWSYLKIDLIKIYITNIFSISRDFSNTLQQSS